MANSPGFVAHVLELMGASAPIAAKAMFGGHGLYDGPRMVALIVDDELFLKCGEADRARFDALGLAPFRYASSRGVRTMAAYRRAPDEALESADSMGEWLRAARQAALASAHARAPKAGPR